MQEDFDMLRCVPYFAGLLVGLVSACSDGGGTSLTVPVNVSPTFTSSATISVEENTTGPVYTVMVSDADGDSVTVSLEGGPDAGLVTLNVSTGEVSFNAALDFEQPADANGDNVYEITLEARD
ncbi:MAG: cadherin repeat domain-containing protein, partial [Pseudomonadota bacterium]